MTMLQLFSLSLLFYTVNATPISYQYVSFIRDGTAKPARSSRSFGDVFETSFWHDGGLHTQTNSLTFEEHRGHITPDFSNGLDYPDPLLLRGQAAKRAATYLYRKPLFFHEINHLNSLLENQEVRKESGLAGNKLGSLRPHLPFYRFKHELRNRFF